MQPLIGITAGEIENSREVWAGPSHGQRHSYIEAVVAAGGVPLILPILDDESVQRALYEQCAGILLSGGNDIDPAKYGAQWNPATKDISPRRDEQELQLIEWALADDKPVLGICRGMQLLNVWFGGSLVQDIPTELPEAADHYASGHKESFTYLAHGLKLDPDSRLAQILGVENIETNALHHQAVQVLGDDLTATAWAEDDIIEAIELSSKGFVVGVQSHPESLINIEPKWRKLFEAFIRNAKKWQPAPRQANFSKDH